MTSRTLAPAVLGGLAALAIFLAPGCGEGVSAPTATTASGTAAGPHGGPAVPIPGEKGYAEIVLDRGAGKSKKAGPVRLAVYFLSSDLKGPLATAPSDVSVKAIPPEGEPLTLTLKPDPADKTRFISEPGQFEYDELRGEVTASVDGASFTQPFAFR